MDLEQKVKQTIKKYNLLSKEDKVVVALSGGKDSTSVLYILHKLGYGISGLFINLYLGKWSEKNLENVKKFCDDLKIKLNVFDLKKEFGSGICFIKDIVRENKGMTGCSVCGILKRWILNKTAKKLGATKLVTGHNLDDECQTVLMNFLKGNIELGFNFGPATGAAYLEGVHPPTLNESRGNDKHKFSLKKIQENFVQRVKPLFFVPENEIKKYSKKMKFPVLYERCPCAFGTYRVETRGWMNEISDAEKLKIVKGWLKTVLKIRRGVENPSHPPSTASNQLVNSRPRSEIKTCESCGEPCRGIVCKACEVLASI